MNLPSLAAFGLTNKEELIYGYLLAQGETAANKLIAISRLKRATVYKTLYSLETKGLVAKRDIKKKIHFRPQPPQRLLDLAEEQIKAQERLRADLSSLLPELTSSYILAVEKPVVATFEGVDGLKKIYEDMLREGKPLHGVLRTHEVEPELYKWLIGPFVKQRVKLGIPVKAIVSTSDTTDVYLKRNEEELRETRVVSQDSFPIEHEMDVYGDKVAFISFRKHHPLIGVLITHPLIAQTMKATFDLAWKAADSV